MNCRFCEKDLSTVNLRFHYARNHLDRPTYEELDWEVTQLESLIEHLRKEITSVIRSPRLER